MFKKLFVVALVAGVAVVALKGTRFFGHVKHEAATLREWAEDQIPVEKKIAQMRKDVGSLDRDIEKVKTELATSIVRVRELTGKTADLRATVETEHKVLVARGEALKNPTENVATNGLTAAESKARLKTAVEQHLQRKAHLEFQEKSLTHQERIKETLEKQFVQMLQQKEDLRVQIDAVEHEYKMVQLQQMESKYQTDDTRLARIKESLRTLRTKLDVEKEKLKLTPKTFEAPAAPVGGPESVDEILAPLTGKVGE